MTGFAIGAILLLGSTLALLLFPFRRRKDGQAAIADLSRKQLNAAIYRDELAEIERDLAEGSLTQADYDTAYAELQRRLIEDSAQEAAAATTAPAGSSAMPAMLGIALPLCAILLYLALGNPAALNPPPPEQRFSADEIERMVSGLAAKLEKEPDNLQGWAMLARSYKAMGRLPDAIAAYERAGKLVDGNADLLVEYADALASSTGGFGPKVIALIDKAISLDPANPQALWLRGTVAFEAQQYDKAMADWENLLTLLEPGSEDARMVQSNIAEAQAKGGKSKGGKDGRKVGAGGTAAFVKGRVALAPSLAGKAAASDMLMVIARPADGSRMPVAVVRVPASQLPLDFTLDDSLAMSPDRKLSQFAEVTIEARISKTGQAVPQPGDLISAASTVKLGTQNLKLEIDQVRK
jgi:cytochrome c-type biogenesis protein CcmH